MKTIIEQLTQLLPTIGDKVISIQGNKIHFESGKTFETNPNSIKINDKIIRAYFDLDETKKELYVWFEFSSGTYTYQNKWNSLVRLERKLKLEEIFSNL